MKNSKKFLTLQPCDWCLSSFYCVPLEQILACPLCTVTLNNSFKMSSNLFLSEWVCQPLLIRCEFWSFIILEVSSGHAAVCPCHCCCEENLHALQSYKCQRENGKSTQLNLMATLSSDAPLMFSLLLTEAPKLTCLFIQFFGFFFFSFGKAAFKTVNPQSVLLG